MLVNKYFFEKSNLTEFVLIFFLNFIMSNLHWMLTVFVYFSSLNISSLSLESAEVAFVAELYVSSFDKTDSVSLIAEELSEFLNLIRRCDVFVSSELKLLISCFVLFSKSAFES